MSAPSSDAPQLTVRGVVTGAALGGVLSVCNVYLGLKIGWSMNMSVTAALIAFAFWQVSVRALRLRPFGILENNLNQTAASAGAAISSAGLVAPIPALTMLTGETLTYPELMVWTLSVGLVGVVVAVGVRNQLLVVDALPFPGGVATGETLKQMYAQGDEAMARVKVLVGGALLGVASKAGEIFLALPKVALPGKVGGASLYNLSFALDPSLLMVGIGAIVGTRGAVSMFLGAVVAWGWLAPELLARGWVTPGAPDKVWFTPLVGWMLWPGVTLMVVASLTSFAFSWRSVLKAFRGLGGAPAAVAPGDISRNLFLGLLVAVMVASVVLQSQLFDIPPLLAALGVLLTFVLALVAGRVSGETGITPVGAMGKVTQLTFGALDPGSVSSNLMAANVTGGAASQCGDLLHDLKTGQMLGAWPRSQFVAQCFGVLGGAVVGSLAYQMLIPDPKTMLLTDTWAAPAVATWKAVAEVFKDGIDAMPTGTPTAMAVAAVAGLGLTLAEKLAPPRVRTWVPSPAALGLAFTIQAYTALSFVVGALLMEGVKRVAPEKADRFGVVLAAGVIAGESLAGAGDAIWKSVQGLLGG